MAVEVKIPAVGESITSGVVSVWHKKSGDFVNAGDALFTLETDKVSTEIAAETSGVLDTIRLPDESGVFHDFAGARTTNERDRGAESHKIRAWFLESDHVGIRTKHAVQIFLDTGQLSDLQGTQSERVVAGHESLTINRFSDID